MGNPQHVTFIILKLFELQVSEYLTTSIFSNTGIVISHKKESGSQRFPGWDRWPCDFGALGGGISTPHLTCSSWPQDGCRSSWHRVLTGSSKGEKGAIRPLSCPETPTPDLPLKLAGQIWETPKSKTTPAKGVAKNGSAKS